MRFKKYKMVIIGLLLVSFIANFFFFIKTKELKEKKGHEVGAFSDIVLRMIPNDILEVLNQEEIISDEDFERIDGEFKVGISFYWLSNGVPEIEHYFRYTEKQFLSFKRAYQESQDKNTVVIKEMKEELVETCEKGLELYYELDSYLDKNSDFYEAFGGSSKNNKESRIWYQVYKNKEHEVRKLIVETLGRDRTKRVL